MEREHLLPMDIQEKLLWPAQLGDAVAVLVRRPICRRAAERTTIAGTPVCNPRGGTQGLHLSNRDELAYGAGLYGTAQSWFKI